MFEQQSLNWFDKAVNTAIRISTLGRHGVTRSIEFIAYERNDETPNKSLSERVFGSTTLFIVDDKAKRVIPRFKII